jgi:hypothetical protein
VACGLLLAFVLAAACVTAAAFGATSSARRAHLRAVRYYGSEIRKLRQETWYWERLMGVPLSPTHARRLEDSSVERLQQLDALWQRRLRQAHRRAQHPPHLGDWMCIHHYEGSWTDAGGPYYGGLQMNLSFQASYGGWLLSRKGTANHWTPLEQIWTAEKALRSRGFTPWPNSARFCGLL